MSSQGLTYSPACRGLIHISGMKKSHTGVILMKPMTTSTVFLCVSVSLSLAGQVWVCYAVAGAGELKNVPISTRRPALWICCSSGNVDDVKKE